VKFGGNSMTKPRRRKNKSVILILLFLLLVIIVSNSTWLKTNIYPLEYESLIRRYAMEYSVDPHLVAAVIMVESSFKPDAQSNNDAKGLMQILPSTGEWIAEKMDLSDYKDSLLFDPEVNIKMGCWYLSFLSSQFQDNIELVLASYNGGIGNVQKWLNNHDYSSNGEKLDYIPFLETRNYVKKVLEFYKIYKDIYPAL
jgi:soluble lytic murein transglycosylase